MYSRMFEGRRAWFAALIFAAVFLVPGVATGQETGGQQAPAEPSAGAVDERFTQPPEDVTLPELPSDPEGTLISAVNAHSASLGYPADHGRAIRDAGMSPELAGRLALLMQAVLACDVPNATPDQRLDCAAAANDAAAGVAQAKGESASGDVQAWPALYVDGDGRKDYYRHDYSVLIDRGGNDTYDNNAGGNLLDVQRGPKGSVALEKGPAIGCEHPHLSSIAPFGTIAPPFDCVSDRQTVLIDQRGDDTYGVFKPPRKVDHNPLPPLLHRKVDGDCTNDPVIRRLVLQGSGFQGNGLLMDESGNDRYRGKTLAQGSGHGDPSGVGLLRDLGGGNDDYLAIRSSQGFSLVNGTGLLQEDGGDDRYHTYMPGPKDPNADPALQEPGSGGVIDDTDQCDSLPRQVQGAALLGNVGRLLDEDGRDTYEGSPKNTQLFLPPGVIFKHSSQGFGCDGGIGVLEDRGADRDRYLRGPQGRRDGASISETRTDCFAAPGQDVFQDDGPNRR